jgi:hypothetical protein
LPRFAVTDGLAKEGARARSAIPGRADGGSKKIDCTETLFRLASLPSVLTWFDHGSRRVKGLRQYLVSLPEGWWGAPLGECALRDSLFAPTSNPPPPLNVLLGRASFPSWYCVRFTRLLVRARSALREVRDGAYQEIASAREVTRKIAGSPP